MIEKKCVDGHYLLPSRLAYSYILWTLSTIQADERTIDLLQLIVDVRNLQILAYVLFSVYAGVFIIIIAFIIGLCIWLKKVSRWQKRTEASDKYVEVKMRRVQSNNSILPGEELSKRFSMQGTLEKNDTVNNRNHSGNPYPSVNSAKYKNTATNIRY